MKGREGGREGGRDGGTEGRREGGTEGRREGRRDGGRELTFARSVGGGGSPEWNCPHEFEPREQRLKIPIRF